MGGWFRLVFQFKYIGKIENIYSKPCNLLIWSLAGGWLMKKRCCYMAYNSQYPNGIFFQSSIFQLSIFQRFLYFNGSLFQRSYISISDERGNLLCDTMLFKCSVRARSLHSHWWEGEARFAILRWSNTWRARSLRSHWWEWEARFAILRWSNARHARLLRSACVPLSFLSL
jgi:hypothetical protein